MPEITLPYDILRIIWRYFYSIYVVSRISNQAKVNTYLQSNNNFSVYSVYSVNYNVLRIMYGMGSVHYSFLFFSDVCLHF